MRSMLKGKRIVVALSLAIVFILMSATFVVASHQFTDVPNTSIYHDFIDWVKDNGITGGCNAAGTKYCPKDPVTREQMAVFLQRTAFYGPSGIVASGVGAETTQSTTFVNLTDAFVELFVPKGDPRIILLTFTAESQCTDDGNDTGFLGVRILVDGVEADPASDTDFAFDSCVTDGAGATGDKWESNSIQRSVSIIPTGAFHEIQVQWRITEAADSGRLDDWHLSAMYLVDQD